tara:strand:- start:2199 stop:2528 length:330 start_codon:yes stop_codon:yes gene_type:complete
MIKMPGNKDATKWTQDRIDKLVSLWKQNLQTREIAVRMQLSGEIVSGYVYRHGKKLGISPRTKAWYKEQGFRFGRRTNAAKSFEQDWAGSVPFGHWIITKPWGEARKNG